MYLVTKTMQRSENRKCELQNKHQEKKKKKRLICKNE